MSPSCVALVVLEKGGFVVCDQDEAKVSDGPSDWEPIWAWEFCPIMVPSMKASLMSLPTFHKSSPVFHNIRPLVPIKIHTVLQFPISPPQFVKPMKCRFNRNGCFSNPLLCENSLDVWTCNDFHKILGLQETIACLFLHPGPDLLCNVFIINDRALFPVQLVEGEVPPPQETQNPFADVSRVVHSTSLHLGDHF